MLDREVEAALKEVRRSRLLLNEFDRWLFREIEPYIGRRILEVGCGHGNFTSLFLNGEAEFVGAIDIDAESVETVRARFGGDPRLKAKVHDICSSGDEELASWKVDTVFSINVLEHIEDDDLALLRMSELLPHSGRLLLIVPAHSWAYGSMDRALGHYRRYTKRAVAERMRAAGLSVERQFYVNLLGLAGWVVNGIVLKTAVPPAGQLRILNRVVPLLRFCERTVRPPAGVSVVTIASRGKR